MQRILYLVFLFLIASFLPCLQAHYALAKAEEQLQQEGRRLVVITQNIDELHRDAGTKNLLELHGL